MKDNDGGIPLDFGGLPITRYTDAESAVEAVRKACPNPSVQLMRQALDAIADVADQLQRQVLEGRLAAALRGSV